MKKATLALHLSLALGLGCDSCENETANASSSSSQESRPSSDELPTHTPDGLEIIHAPQQRGPERSRPGDSRPENLVREPTSPDPRGGLFTLEEAVEGLGNDGTLITEIRTDFGTILCDLYADQAPNTVANFIGLARGLRPWWDARAGQWVERPHYNRTEFHRVIPGYLIQGGDYLADGTGRVGYTVDDEPHPELRHDRAGQLCMANFDDEPNSSGAQFFITDGPAPQLDEGGKYTIFGQCMQTDLVSQIARVPQRGEEAGHRPITDVQIIRVFVRRQRGGAQAAERTPPVAPPGVDPENPTQRRGASPGPAELREYPGHAPSEPNLPENLRRHAPPRHHDGHRH